MSFANVDVAGIDSGRKGIDDRPHGFHTHDKEHGCHEASDDGPHTANNGSDHAFVSNL